MPADLPPLLDLIDIAAALQARLPGDRRLQRALGEEPVGQAVAALDAVRAAALEAHHLVRRVELHERALRRHGREHERQVEALFSAARGLLALRRDAASASEVALSLGRALACEPVRSASLSVAHARLALLVRHLQHDAELLRVEPGLDDLRVRGEGLLAALDERSVNVVDGDLRHASARKALADAHHALLWALRRRREAWRIAADIVGVPGPPSPPQGPARAVPVWNVAPVGAPPPGRPHAAPRAARRARRPRSVPDDPAACAATAAATAPDDPGRDPS